jgi:DNA-binding NtrC family response regulator
MDRSLRVLHVEDSEQDVALLTRHLSRAGYELVSERVETPTAFSSALETQEWDVILCDYSMPHFDALQALALLKELELDLPFIIISGTVGEATAVEAMRAGAHDYLMKDSLARLVPTIERELHEADNRRARRQAEKRSKLPKESCGHSLKR